MENIILIGMPAAGKSTVGVLVAKHTLADFIDADLVIQAREKAPLADIIEARGEEAFLALEEAALLSIVPATRAVVATGGSAIYSRRGMDYLRSIGTVVYLKIPYEDMISRIGNITTRGVILHGTTSLREIYEERCPLYEAAADITIEVSHRSTAECAQAVAEAVNARRKNQ